MEERVPPRLFVILARRAPIGLVFRRGPSKWVLLSKWNTQTDTVARGQWFHGRIYERRCDLSPDGKFLVYFAFNGKMDAENKGSWTGISKAPYVAALAIWPNGTTLGGGGFFLNDRKLFLNWSGEPLRGRGPRGVEVTHAHPFTGVPTNQEDLGVYFPRLKRDGWELLEEGPGIVRWAKRIPASPHRIIKRSLASVQPATGTGTYSDEHAIELAGGQVIEMPGVEWADWDHAGRLVFARDGKLWAGRIDGSDLSATELADFNQDKPAAKPTPAWAQKW